MRIVELATPAEVMDTAIRYCETFRQPPGEWERLESVPARVLAPSRDGFWEKEYRSDVNGSTSRGCSSVGSSGSAQQIAAMSLGWGTRLPHEWAVVEGRLPSPAPRKWRVLASSDGMGCGVLVETAVLVADTGSRREVDATSSCAGCFRVREMEWAPLAVPRGRVGTLGDRLDEIPDLWPQDDSMGVQVHSGPGHCNKVEACALEGGLNASDQPGYVWITSSVCRWLRVLWCSASST